MGLNEFKKRKEVAKKMGGGLKSKVAKEGWTKKNQETLHRQSRARSQAQHIKFNARHNS